MITGHDTFLLAVSRLWLAGKSPVMPGTCGSFVAIVLAPVLFMPLPLWGRVAVLLLVLAAGVMASGRAEILLQRKDPSEVVIDELLGQWIACLPFAALGFWEYAAAFALFRFFDILKPWPIRKLEAIGGGLGIMLDDALAGVYAMICLAALRWAWL